MRKAVLFIALAVSLVLAACGGKQPDPVDLITSAAEESSAVETTAEETAAEAESKEAENSAADEDEEEVEGGMSKSDLLKMQKERKKVAKNNSKFRR